MATTVYEVAPNCGMKFVFFSGTTAQDGKVDMTAYSGIASAWAQLSTISGITAAVELNISGIDRGYLTISGGAQQVAGFAFVVE